MNTHTTTLNGREVKIELEVVDVGIGPYVHFGAHGWQTIPRYAARRAWYMDTNEEIPLSELPDHIGQEIVDLRVEPHYRPRTAGISVCRQSRQAGFERRLHGPAHIAQLLARRILIVPSLALACGQEDRRRTRINGGLWWRSFMVRDRQQACSASQPFGL